MDTVLVTYIYPKAVNFFPDFIDTIESQTTNNFKVLIFNDGVENIECFTESVSLDTEVIELSGSIPEIRFQSLLILKKREFNNIVFQDIDDLMSENRIEKSIYYLNKYSLICNDLSLFEGNVITSSNIWKGRLGNRFEFSVDFLVDKNILGLGNTSIKKEVLNVDFKTSDIPIAVDWFIFYQILFLNKSKALFVTDCQTIYRQHENNVAGSQLVIDTQRLKEVIKVKRLHYNALNNIGIQCISEIKRIEIIERKINLNKTIQIEPQKRLFWWEETNHL